MPAQLTDIEEKVKVWAWDTFMRTRSKEHAKLRFEDVHLEINWSRVKFISSPPEFYDERRLEKPNSQVVFKSKYENRTAHEQEHSFQTQRTTVSSCVTTVSKGFIKGFQLEVKLGLPKEVATATAGFGREVHMETADQDCHEQSMTWAINSSIRVPPNHRTIAELVVKEQDYSASFKMNVQVRGKVLAVLTNLKENNCFVQSIEGEFSNIMKRESDKKGYTIEGNTVTWELEGKCQFRFGIEQHVQLSEELL